jgi:hypothetical protein
MSITERRAQPRERAAKSVADTPHVQAISFEQTSIGLPADDHNAARAGGPLVRFVLAGMLVGALLLAALAFTDSSRDHATIVPRRRRRFEVWSGAGAPMSTASSAMARCRWR